MVQVKIIRSKAKDMEERINKFLVGLGSQTGVKVSLVDIKLYHIASEDMDTAMIIYNSSVISNFRQKKPQQIQRQNSNI